MNFKIFKNAGKKLVYGIRKGGGANFRTGMIRGFCCIKISHD